MKYIVIILILLVAYIAYCDYSCTKENFVDGGDSGIYYGSSNPNTGDSFKNDSPIVPVNKLNSTEQFNVNDSENTDNSAVTSNSTDKTSSSGNTTSTPNTSSSGDTTSTLPQVRLPTQIQIHLIRQKLHKVILYQIYQIIF